MTAKKVKEPAVLYRVDAEDKIAWITLNRPQRGNGITGELCRELAACVERANLDTRVSVIALTGSGKIFCGGYDLELSTNLDKNDEHESATGSTSSNKAEDVARVTHPLRQAINHKPNSSWDATIDYQMMMRNVRCFMSLFYSEKPTVAKLHGSCVAGGTDMALCADFLIVEDSETFKIGYPPARVWGVPTTALWAERIGAQRAKRLLLTGDCLTGKQAVEYGLALECVAPGKIHDVFLEFVRKLAKVPLNQLIMNKAVINQQICNAYNLNGMQMLSVYFDGVARHTDEGYEFQKLAAREGFKTAVKGRDQPHDGPRGFPVVQTGLFPKL